MKTLSDYINMCIMEGSEEGKITSEKEFREWARSKFEEVFGDELDEKRMKFTVDGFLKNNKDKVDAGEWAELVGMFNQSFAK